MRNSLLLTSTVLFLATAGPAHASEPMSAQDMQRQMEALSAQVDKLTALVAQQGAVINQQNVRLEGNAAQIQEQKEKQAAVIDNLAGIAPAAGTDTPDIKITMKPTLKVESADGKYSFQPFGRVHLDATLFQDDRHDYPDNANFRRARLGFKGDMGEDFNYKAEIDFGGEAVNLKEVWLTYTGLGFADVQLGNFKPPVGLEQNTGTNYMEFMELAPVSGAFTRDEIIGAALKGGGENWSLAGGVFNEDPGTSTVDDEAESLDVRGSVDLLQNSPDVLHVGLGVSARVPNATGSSVTLASKPAGTGTNMVSTGVIANVDRAYVYDGELAGVFGPFSVEGEYMRYAAQRNGASDPDFDGWYAQASYFLTGETRPYKGKTGNFERVKPKSPFSLKNGGAGAWEILARYDTLDLNDISAGVAGGAISDWTLGVNWYLRDNIRLMLNYVDVNTDSHAVVPNDDPQIINLRAQWDF